MSLYPYFRTEGVGGSDSTEGIFDCSQPGSTNMHPVIFSLRRSSRAIPILIVIAVCAAETKVDTYAEQGDAGQLPATAQVVSTVAGPKSLTAITGTLTLTNGISEADLYEIYISTPASFSANTTGFVAGKNNFDTQLFLFRTNGAGIVANDDDPSGGGAQSSIPAGNSFTSSLSAGPYLLLITGSGEYPATSTGSLIFNNFTDGTTDPTAVEGPNTTSPLASYTGNSNEGGNYSIALTGVTVPEPGLGFAGIAIMGTIFRRRRSPLATLRVR